MIRILHVIGSMGSGGAEAIIMNIYRKIDRSKIQFDFVVHTKKKAFYDDEIRALGGKIYTAERYNVVNCFSYKRYWDDFFTKHPEYQIIHGHINSSAAIYLSSAKKHGRVAVAHSHATKNTEKSLKAWVFLLSTYPIRYIADYFWGCSRQAGIDRYGIKVVESERFHVLKNGIAAEKYIYNAATRAKIRTEYNISDSTYVIGHVGRFTFAKNHAFLLDVFMKIHQIEPDSKLMLIGKGELEDDVRKKVRDLQLESSVIFVGQVKNVFDYLQAMDTFIFPSVFEGLGISLVEAQAAGLPCIVSENIQEEAKLPCGLVHTLNIHDGADAWAKMAMKLHGTERKNTFLAVKDAGFNIQESAQMLAKFYEDILQNKIDSMVEIK